MGEMADFVNEQGFDDELAWDDYRLGYMNCVEAYERGIIDELGYEFSAVKNQTGKTCRCCGESGLRWGKIKEKFVLLKGSEMHKCPINPLKEIK